MSWNHNSWDSQNWYQSQWKSDNNWDEDMSSASGACDWQQTKRLPQQVWSTSTPKKQKTENQYSKWDHIGSPTGHPPHVGSSVDKNLPPTFQSDSEYYDKNEIWGKKLPRKVLTTEWSKTHGLAGRDLTKVSLPELLYMGWQNHGLRYLGQGWFTGAVLTRNIRESVLVEKVLKQVRQKGIDIDAAALHVAKMSGHTINPNMTNAEKANLIDLLAQHVLAPLQTNKEVESEMMDLRRQLEEAQSTIGKLQAKQPTLPETDQEVQEHTPPPSPGSQPEKPTRKPAVLKAKSKANPEKKKRKRSAVRFSTSCSSSKHQAQVSSCQVQSGPSKDHPATVPDSIPGLITHDPTEAQKVLSKFPMSSYLPRFLQVDGQLTAEDQNQEPFTRVFQHSEQCPETNEQRRSTGTSRCRCQIRLHSTFGWANV